MASLSAGTLHKLPKDMHQVLSHKDLHPLWESLTPLARNEFICWVTSPKKQETREKRITQMGENLKEGKRRPCCWPGCPHRRESAKKWFK